MTDAAEMRVDFGEPLPQSIYEAPEPIVLRGYVDGWPAVAAAKMSGEHLADYLTQFDAQQALTVYVGPKEIGGRFFYNDDFTGFNFQSGKATLAQVLGRLLGPKVEDNIDAIYVGSTPVDDWLPGFRKSNDVALPVDDALANFWLGGRTTISAHFDFPDNLACVVAGARRFTLFPPDQLANLYVGPLDRTPSGQAISLVDFDAPDFDRHPRFKDALEASVVADLQPGDALFIPSMWWHHVRSSEPLNMLVNYWWCNTPPVMGAPSAVLNHAILALRELSPRQRRAWQELFNYYVFEADPDSFGHIPEAGRGVLGELSDESINWIRADLAKRFN